MRQCTTHVITLAAVVLCCGLATTALAAETLAYEGTLSDGDRQPVADGAYDFELALFTAPEGGAPVWSEAHVGVPVEDGRYAITLGDAAPIDLVHGSYWLQVTVAGETLAPRTRLTLGGGSSGDAVPKRSNCTVDGWLDVTGGVTANSAGASAWGVTASGPTGGGRFEDIDGTSAANVASGGWGIWALGDTGGGHFADDSTSPTGYADVGIPNWGIQAWGNSGGGYFADSSVSRTGYAYLGVPNYGIQAFGTWAGGKFHDSNGDGFAEVGRGNEGIRAYGSQGGGYFATSNSNPLHVAQLGGPVYGIDAFSHTSGGRFRNADSSPTAEVFAATWDGYGIWARGTSAGGSFNLMGTGAWSDVPGSTAKIEGTGSIGFVQNHPYQSDRVIVYNAAEGDEVATYTRGTARLVNGEARIALGETFKWVTNPDIGLTAHLTPRSEPVPLAVVSLTTEELVVRGTADVAFDYIVHGLRIGFEEVSVVREKRREAWIPAMDSHRQLYDIDPDLRRYNAMERFKVMEAEARGLDPENLDLSRAEELRDAIHEFDPEVDPMPTVGER